MPSLTRRSFVASAAALPLAMRSLGQPAAAPKWVFLGTNKGPGIFRCAWNPATGTLGAPELAVKADRPDHLALHPRLPRLYAVNSSTGGMGTVSSFRLDRASGGLQIADTQSSLGDGPCFVSVDATGRSAFAANYSGGSFVAYALAADGALKPPTGSFDCRNNPECGVVGPAHDRQDGPHLHCANVSPGNDFVLACNLGNDSIEVFSIHPGAANPLGAAQRVPTRPGSGPRHLAFHPNGGWVYVIHELDCTVELYHWVVLDKVAHLRRQDGTAVSTLAQGVKLNGETGCEILVAPNGKFVYASSRFASSNTVTVFAVNAKTGQLKQQQVISCGGEVPRHIALDPSGRWLLVANQGSSTVTVFAHDAATGRLTGPTQTVAADTPMFVQFV
jgi:6-phosphogluconolactonase